MLSPQAIYKQKQLKDSQGGLPDAYQPNSHHRIVNPLSEGDSTPNNYNSL